MGFTLLHTEPIPEVVTITPKDRAAFDASMATFLKDGWKVTNDGPSGVQLEGTKKMSSMDKGCLWLGMLTFWIYGLGIFFIAIAMIDYAFLTKPPTRFIYRPSTSP